MRKWRKGIKRILAVAVAAVLMGGSMEWSTLQVAAAEMNEPILTEGEENITPEGTENTDNIIIEMESQVEYIELPELETSAMSMMMFALGANEKVPLKSTNHANWIDRLDLTGADYAMTFYNWLVENSDNDGTEDALIIPVEDGTTVKVVYGSLCYVLKEFTGTVDFTFAAGADGETISAAAGNAVNAAIAGRVDEVAKYAHTVYSAFDRDNPQVFWLDGASSVTSEVKSSISYSSNGTGTATYTQTIGFVLTNNDFDIRESKYAAMETAALRNKISEVNSQVNTILAGVSAQATDYEKVK